MQYSEAQCRRISSCRFGQTIACGDIDGDKVQKDYITLEDVDYGHSGRWAFSVWYKHEEGQNYENYQREQFFGHGNPLFTTGARNQVHIQFERDDGILAIIKDNDDFDRYTIPCMKQYCCPSEDSSQEACDAFALQWPNCFKGERLEFGEDQAAEDCWRQEARDSASFETKRLVDYTGNGLWHHLVLTTRKGGPGMDMYIDGKLEAAHPYSCDSSGENCVGINKGNTGPNYRNWVTGGVGGDPIDPTGRIRLCTRQLGGAIWNDDFNVPNTATAHNDRRYFRGQVAHFAMWDYALDARQVEALTQEYRKTFGIVHHDGAYTTDWEATCLANGWKGPCPAAQTSRRGLKVYPPDVTSSGKGYEDD